MAEILGLGVTHFPGLASDGSDPGVFVRRALANPALPARYQRPEGWPDPMRREWGDDAGVTASQRHREALIRQFRKARQVLDEFAPDFIVIWGDDQDENFKEDLIPAFCIHAYDSVEVRPWSRSGRGPNAWGEPPEKTFLIKGHRSAGKFIAGGLLEAGFDVAYTYKPLHHDLGHAFVNTVLFLDWNRQGFDYPVVPFQVNCYGRRVISWRGGAGQGEADLGPPSPLPWRCFGLGAMTARLLAPSPWRVALIASSSWSHAFLAPKNHYLCPDIEADRALYEALVAGDYDTWRNRTLSEIEESGEQEVLNWMCLVGAMAELGRKPDEAEFIESYMQNSPQCFAYFHT